MLAHGRPYQRRGRQTRLTEALVRQQTSRRWESRRGAYNFRVLKRFCLLAVGLAVIAVMRVGAQPPPPTIAIKAARLFDGKSDVSLADAVVLVQGSRITAAGARLAIPAGAQVIDLGDVTILPGFIDAHTHVTDESSNDWNADAAPAFAERSAR